MIWILAILSIIHLLECWNEVRVIALKNPYLPDYDERNRKEHFSSAVLASAWLAVFIYFSFDRYGNDAWWILPALVVNRRIFFDYALIIWMDWSYYKYQGNGWWDRMFKSVFGTNGRVKELGVELCITVFSIIKMTGHG